jgi:hypothetical protein
MDCHAQASTSAIPKFLSGLESSTAPELGRAKESPSSGNIIPGNIGLYEAANMGILKLLGFPSAIGLAVALARDMRRIFWVGTGLVLFFASGSTSIQTN